MLVRYWPVMEGKPIGTRIRKAVSVETGVFGAMMKVALVNDGPVTFVLDEPPA